MKQIDTDVIVVGSGIAGLYSALKLSRYGDVTVITKGAISESNSSLAQGGIAVSYSPEDSPEQHRDDTLACGCGISNRHHVDLLTRTAPALLEELFNMGVPFDRTDNGELMLGKEGYHSNNRIVHALGDATGHAMVQTLLKRVRSRSKIFIHEHTLVEDLLVEGDRCFGVTAFDGTEHRVYVAKAVILATGGSGQIYEHTTNVVHSTGDGYAMAYRAGAALVDMEFFQFHPTALLTPENPRKLISEAVRGEGAILVDEKGTPFMKDYHPWADLAPRDVVSRAIFSELQKGHKIFLDATRIGTSFPSRFPGIHRILSENGIDPRIQWIPVSPAAHFMMGGIESDDRGRTTLKGLYACGETACTGIHGANRLASNSLLEAFVFAERVSKAVMEEASSPSVLAKNVSRWIKPRYHADQYRISPFLFPIVNKLKKEMWKHAGIIRNPDGLKKLESKLERALSEWGTRHITIENMITTALLVVKSALYREESRGAHFREDYPLSDSSWNNKRSKWRAKNESNVT